MDPELATLPIRSRRASFDAAARCLSLGPVLRRGGIYCIIIGVAAVLVLLARHDAAASPTLWAYVAVLALGIYLLTPAPAPWAMPAAGLVILAVLAQSWFFAWRIWRVTHVLPGLGPIGSILEIIAAATLLAGYFGYRRHRGDTDEATLRELRTLGRAIFRADPHEDTQVAGLRCRSARAQLCRVDGLVVMALGRRSAVRPTSVVGRIEILEPNEIALRIVAERKPGAQRKLRLAVSRLPKLGKPTWAAPPESLRRLEAMGVGITHATANAASR